MLTAQHLPTDPTSHLQVELDQASSHTDRSHKGRLVFGLVGLMLSGVAVWRIALHGFGAASESAHDVPVVAFSSSSHIVRPAGFTHQAGPPVSIGFVSPMQRQHLDRRTQMGMQDALGGLQDRAAKPVQTNDAVSIPSGVMSHSAHDAASGTEIQQNVGISRRSLIRGSSIAAGMHFGVGKIADASAYTVDPKVPEAKDTYAVAQRGGRHLKVLELGSADLKAVFQDRFRAGNDVIALDLELPDPIKLREAMKLADQHGYQLRFEQGDATKLKFADETFDVVVCSMFLCQDFDPEVVVSEIRRVLKPGGRFGFSEHVENIDKVIVDRVFGERSVIQVQANPRETNVIAGVVRKV